MIDKNNLLYVENLNIINGIWYVCILEMVVKEMKKDFTKFVVFLLLILMVFSMIESTRIFVFATELENQQEENGQKNFLESRVARITGWHKVGNTWYYFNKNGIMQTGWLKQGNQWYYLNSSGAMVTNWQKTGNTWYYFKSNGVMQTGWLKQGNQWYYLNSSGAMVTNWQKTGNTWYYFKSNGVMQTGWLKQGNQWYYLSSSGAMATSWQKIENTWYYFNNDGSMKTGWLQHSGAWYYLGSGGEMYCNGSYQIDGEIYQFDSNGKMQTGEETPSLTYVGSKNSNIFHKENCPTVKNISQSNYVVYVSREDAINKNKRPCNVCNP